MRETSEREASPHGPHAIDAPRPLASRHRSWGWWCLFAFATLGLVLESLHGMRISWYVDAHNETRQTMFRLAHAHGSLLALINVVFGVSIASGPDHRTRGLGLASTCLLAATLLLPLGFALGGLWFHEGDPGVGIALVPLGALSLLASLVLIARNEC